MKGHKPALPTTLKSPFLSWFCARHAGQLSNVMGCLTTYGIGSAPPFYGTGYVPQVRTAACLPGVLVVASWRVWLWHVAGSAPPSTAPATCPRYVRLGVGVKACMHGTWLVSSCEISAAGSRLPHPLTLLSRPSGTSGASSSRCSTWRSGCLWAEPGGRPLASSKRPAQPRAAMGRLARG